MKTVVFKNGMYGIRKGWFKPFYRYLDFDSDSRNYIRWRKKEYDLFECHCMASVFKVVNVFKCLKDFGKDVKDFGDDVTIIG